jgi:hypothetical protein
VLVNNAAVAIADGEGRPSAVRIDTIQQTFHLGTQHPSEGAKVVVGAATLPADGPSGSFFDVNGSGGW